MLKIVWIVCENLNVTQKIIEQKRNVHFLMMSTVCGTACDDIFVLHWNYSNTRVSSLVPRPSHPVFVTCSTTTGEGLVKLITCTDHGQREDIWRSGSFWEPTSEWVHYWSQPPTAEQLRSQRQAVLEKFLRFRRPPTAVPKCEATSPMSAMSPHVSF